MPRTARASVGGVIYHATNRGNRDSEIFHQPVDYDAFLEGIVEAISRHSLDLYGYCLMPNHFHLVVRPQHDGDLGHLMRRLLMSHAQRHHRLYKTSGHVWQGRYKAFPVQDDMHLPLLLRHLERNPVRSGLVAQPQFWRWSSLPGRLIDDPSLSGFSSFPGGTGWLNHVNQPLSDGEIQRINESLDRERPFGTDDWTREPPQSLVLNQRYEAEGDLERSENESLSFETIKRPSQPASCGRQTRVRPR